MSCSTTPRNWVAVIAVASSAGPSRIAVQGRGPGCGARLQHGHERVGPARNELRGCLRAPVDVAGQALGRAWRVRAKPRRRIDCQDRTPAVEPRQRQPGQHRPQPGDVRGFDVVAVGGELDEGGVQVAGVPEDDGVGDQARVVSWFSWSSWYAWVDLAAAAVAFAGARRWWDFCSVSCRFIRRW